MKTNKRPNALLALCAGVCLCANSSQAAGMLKGSSDYQIVPILNNLTLEGNLDWVRWDGSEATSRKDALPNLLDPNLTLVGEGSQSTLAGPISFEWTDGYDIGSGTPVPPGTNYGGVIARGINGSGFEFTVKADTTTRLLRVYAGVRLGTNVLTATLSDGSAPPYVDVGQVRGNIDGAVSVYTIVYAAASDGQTLTVNTLCSGYDTAPDNGSLLLCAATLGTLTPKVIAQPADLTKWLTQSAQFTADGIGDWPLTFQWHKKTAGGDIALADGGNVSGATSKTLTLAHCAAADAGGYYFTANNSSGSATSVVAQLTVKDMVPDGKLSGTAKDYGHLELVNLTADGTLDWVRWEGAGEAYATIRKDVATKYIDENFEMFGIGRKGGYANWSDFIFPDYTWTDGTPTPSGTSEGGVNYYVSGEQAYSSGGFRFTVEADATPKVLTVYAGSYNCTNELRAVLSDGSADAYVNVDCARNVLGGWGPFQYKITFAASPQSPPGQKLTVTATDIGPIGASWCSANIAAASLALAPQSPILSYRRDDTGKLVLTWSGGLLLEAAQLAGPWSPNSANSPFTVTPSGPQKFFKVMAP